MEEERISICKMEVLESDMHEIPSTTLTAIGNSSHTLTTSENKAICDECFKEFASANTLWAHKKRFHCGDPPLKCDICYKPFYVLFRLTYHLKDKHGLSGDRLEKCLADHSSKWHITCFDTECQQRFRRMSNYHEHLCELHGLNVESEVKEFASLEEFNQWFEMVERYNSSHYVQHRGERPDRNSIKSKLLFCHRSGFARSRTVKGVRKGRKRDTCKISGYCSSFMEVNQYPDDSVKVKYWKNHVGHGTSNEEDIIHLPIPQCEKEHIAGIFCPSSCR
ncbi:unnamed protein product [Meganyctiphanes norvegica]|uniref:C2H2-type domain-containing protein n=1 Tax=Meganyctiphanes norvegica TaxID=48144 RepID=A0AAV2R9Y6_MEGNR